MKTEQGADPFRERLWPRIRGRLFHKLILARRPMTLGVRAVVHDGPAKAIFLIRHTYVPGWQLPGGGVDPGETAAEAVAREVFEECAIRLTAPPALRSVHFSRHVSRRDHVLVYLATDFEVVGPKRPDREIAEAGFFPLDRLPALTTPSTRRRLAEIFDGLDPLPDW